MKPTQNIDTFPIANFWPTWLQARIFSTTITVIFLLMLYFSPATSMAKLILFFVPGIFTWGFCLMAWKIKMVR